MLVKGAPGDCAIWDIRPKVIFNTNLSNSRLRTTYFPATHSFYNFAQGTALLLPCSVKHKFKTIGQLKQIWTNEVWNIHHWKFRRTHHLRWVRHIGPDIYGEDRSILHETMWWIVQPVLIYRLLYIQWILDHRSNIVNVDRALPDHYTHTLYHKFYKFITSKKCWIKYLHTITMDHQPICLQSYTNNRYSK